MNCDEAIVCSKVLQYTDLIIIISEKRAPGTPTKWHIIEEQPIDASLHSQGVESPKRITVEEPTKFSCTPSTSRHSQFKMSYGNISFLLFLHFTDLYQVFCH